MRLVGPGHCMLLSAAGIVRLFMLSSFALDLLMPLLTLFALLRWVQRPAQPNIFHGVSERGRSMILLQPVCFIKHESNSVLQKRQDAAHR